jgi:DNA-binding transcriptional MerR regulator
MMQLLQVNIQVPWKNDVGLDFYSNYEYTHRRMNEIKLIVSMNQNIYPLDENEYEGVPLHWSELQDKLKKYTNGTLNIPLSTIRWYQHKGLIEKPNRGANGALYIYRTFYDLLAIRTLRYHFNFSIARIIELRSTGYHLYSIAWVLQHLEQEVVNHFLAPDLNSYVRELSREYVEMDDPKKLIKHAVSVERLKNIKKEWGNMLTMWPEIRDKMLVPLHVDYFELLLSGHNPMEICIEFSE